MLFCFVLCWSVLGCVGLVWFILRLGLVLGSGLGLVMIAINIDELPILKVHVDHLQICFGKD